MMMIPRRHELSLWDDMFRDPFFSDDVSKVMRTDIKEKKDKYLIDVELPGYNKENIKIEIEDGYMTIHATTKTDDTENDDDGTFLRRERYFGECSRSFYVGDNITEEDIKASFKNGTLKIEIPKKDEQKQVPEKKYIQIDD